MRLTNQLTLCLLVAAAVPALGQDVPPPAFGGQPAEPAPPARPPAPKEAIIQEVRIQRNRFIPAETLLYYVSTKAGDRYDERRLREDFQRLWETGFLDDLLIDVQDGKTGKIVTFSVEERRRVQIVDFRGSKALSASNIQDELKKRELSMKIDSFYDEGDARIIEAIIKEMLGAKGRPFATVKHETKPMGGGSGVQVSFVIDDGGKARVRKIEFTGNKIFSDGSLRGSMKKIREASFKNYTWLNGKSTYTEEKWSDPQEGDRRRIEDHYLNRGYVTATVGEPKITYYDGKTRPFPWFKSKPVKWMKLEIPVTEGEQYRVGSLSFEGLTVFKEEGIRTLFKLKPGEIYNESRFKKAYDKLRELYGTWGYFQWQPLTQRKPDAEKKVVDVVIKMEEDKRYYVGKITFTGNEMTHDKVIRREVYLNEGETFNTEALKQSIRRINQLGYFKPMEAAPEIEPSREADDQLNVTFKVEEQNRNQFSFGAGVSGLEGTFINASFQTSNFLGAGETLSLSAQSGARTKTYEFGVTEPYVFDRPITAGIRLFKTRIEYQTADFTGEHIQGYFDDRLGVALTTGFPLGRFTRLYLGYSFESVKITIGELPGGNTVIGGVNPNRPVVSRVFLEDAGKRYESEISPSVVQNTVDNPWTPRSGRKLTVSLGMAGGPLGGSLDFLKPNLEAIYYFPHTKRSALGLRAQASWVVPFGETADIDPRTGRNRLPFYQRFLLGGEQQVRGFDVRTLGPVTVTGLPIANKFLLANAEYYIDIAGPLRAVLFFDAGRAYAEGTPIAFNGFNTSTGIELRFIMPVLNVPFRLIYAWNPTRENPGLKEKGFRFAVGTTF